MAKRKIFLAEKVITDAHEGGILWCMVLAKTIPITIPTTRGEIPKFLRTGKPERKVAMVAMSATNVIPLNVPLRLLGEKGMNIL